MHGWLISTLGNYRCTGTRAGINAGGLMQFSMTLNKFGEINRGVRMQDKPSDGSRKYAMNSFEFLWIVLVKSDRDADLQLNLKSRTLLSFFVNVFNALVPFLRDLSLPRIRISNFVHDVSVSTWVCIVFYVDREWRGVVSSRRKYTARRHANIDVIADQKVQSYHIPLTHNAI